MVKGTTIQNKMVLTWFYKQCGELMSFGGFFLFLLHLFSAVLTADQLTGGSREIAISLLCTTVKGDKYPPILHFYNDFFTR